MSNTINLEIEKNNGFKIGKELLEMIWNPPYGKSILNKQIDQKLYDIIKENVPYPIIIETIFSKDEIEKVWHTMNFTGIDSSILPFLVEMNHALICIGYKKDNYGKIFYMSGDFGTFPFEDNLTSFLKKLK